MANFCLHTRSGKPCLAVPLWVIGPGEAAEQGLYSEDTRSRGSRPSADMPGSAGAGRARSGVCACQLPADTSGRGLCSDALTPALLARVRGGPISAPTVLDRTRGVKENGRDPEDNRVGAFLRLCGPTGAGRRDPGAPPSLCGLGLVGADSPGLSPLSRASSLPRLPEGYLATASPEEAVLSQ